MDIKTRTNNLVRIISMFNHSLVNWMNFIISFNEIFDQLIVVNVSVKYYKMFLNK
jgi:hypothetical protein